MTPIEQQPDDVPGRPVLVTATAAVVTITGTALLVWVLALWARGGVSSPHLARGWEHDIPEDVNGLELPVFALETAAERQAHVAAARLASYGWTDRANGRVHIPIEVAIDLLVRRPDGVTK